MNINQENIRAVTHIHLAFYAEFTDPNIAIATEKQIKKWYKAKKEALINGEFDNLPNLAKKKLTLNGSRYKILRASVFHSN